MIPVGIEPIIPASEQLQTNALDRAVSGISPVHEWDDKITEIIIN